MRIATISRFGIYTKPRKVSMASGIKTFLRRLSSISSASLKSSSREVQVTWGGAEHEGRVGRYPVTWLRDNCQCSDCFDSSCVMRKLPINELDLTIVPANVKVADSKKGLKVLWPNGHSSTFQSDWLMARDFGKHGHQFVRPSNSVLKLSPKLWGSEMKNNMKTMEYEELMENDKLLYEWLVTVEEDGIALLKHSPKTTWVLKEIGKRVGHLRTSVYGEQFIVRVKENPSNLAYTTGYLPLHVDMSMYYDSPGVQLLQFVSQPKAIRGGESLFVDGFTAALDLREKHPDAFQLLTSAFIDIRDIGDDFYKYHLHHLKHTINLDEEGEVCGIAFSNPARDSLSHIPLESVQPVYEALSLLDSYFYDPKNLIAVKMEEGDIMTFNNYRVLHGRKSYEVTEGPSERLLCGAYIQWDEMRSRRRVLAEELGV